MSRYQDVAEDLRRRILSGELAPGERLPTEPEMCTVYGVSRSTVREALRVLSSQNLVETARGVTGGTFVAVPKPGEISAYLENSLAMLAVNDAVGVESLLEVRDLLEVPAAGLAARRADPAALEELRGTIVDPVASGLAEIQDCNHRFHTMLIKAAGNPLLDAVAGPVFAVLVSRSVREPVVDVGYWNVVVDDHRLILDAVAAGDEDRSRHLMREHLDRLRGTYVTGSVDAGAVIRPG